MPTVEYLQKLALEQKNPQVAFRLSDAGFLLLKGTEQVTQALYVIGKTFGKGVYKGGELYWIGLKRLATDPVSVVRDHALGPLMLACDVLTSACTLAFGSHESKAEIYKKLNDFATRIKHHPEDGIVLLLNMMLPPPTGLALTTASRASKGLQALKKAEHRAKDAIWRQHTDAVEVDRLAGKNFDPLTSRRPDPAFVEPARSAVSQALLRTQQELVKLKQLMQTTWGKVPPDPTLKRDHIIKKVLKRGGKKDKLSGERLKRIDGYHTEHYEPAVFEAGSLQPPNQWGAYKGTVIVPGAEPKVCSLFPKAWNIERIEQAFKEAWENPIRKLDHGFIGMTKEGMEIRIILKLDENSKIIKLVTYFPEL